MNTMRTLRKTFWLLCALLVMGQAVLPALANVQCVSPSAAAPCAQTTLLAADAAGAKRFMASMPCCRHMAQVCPATPQATPPPSTSRLTSPPCHMVSAVSGTQVSAVTTSVRQWMLTCVPALAPPAPSTTSAFAPDTQTVAFFVFTPPPHPASCPAAHTLRGPPAA